MLHTHRKPRYFDNQDVSATEPYSKRMKSTEETFGKSYEELQILHEEIHIKKTHSGFIPLSLSDDEAQEEKETTDISFNKAFFGNKTVSSHSSDSVKNTKVRGSKCILSTNNASVVHNGENNGVKHKNEGETGLYSTSTAFIGPIYKSEADHRHDKRKTYTNSNCPKVSGRMTHGHPKKEMTSKDAPFCDVPKIEDELSQFYSEINQLENNEHCLDVHLQATETNLNVQSMEYNKPIQVVSVDSREWSCKTSTNWGDGQCFYKESTGHGTGSEPYTHNNPTHSRIGSEQCCNNERGVWEAQRLCNKQEGSRFWNDPTPQFKPTWQQTHPFIIPYGPPPPQLTTQFSLQDTNSSPFQSHVFHSSNVGPYKNAHISMSSSTSDQSNAFVSHFGTHNMQTSRNGHNVPDGHAVNGFCETQGGWKDVKTCQNEESNIVSQQFSENKLCESQKTLLILRGLPGSGKTTLSHILLDHSRDGIVFSTDDYFRQNNGYWSYNIGLLGAAHDWNQKRAKQAMDQGRSPIIIDNTNTQAWEMKPYVEAALEKGYQVEFCEPDTWWKFNPEELEKRNEHGVSREKIVQMLERYEYQMSIPIVMNSVLPFHKTSQRPPPQRRQRELVVKKKHRLEKMKQRKKRKRNRKIRDAAIKAMRNKSSSQLTSSDEDSSQSGHKDSEDSGKPAFVTGHPNEPKEGGEDGSANDNDVKLSKMKKGNFPLSRVVGPVTLSSSPEPEVLAGNSSLSVPHENIIKQSFDDHLLNTTQSLNFIESSRNILGYSNQNSSLKLDHSDTDNSTILTNIEDKDTSTKVVELSLENKQLNDTEEATILHQRGASQMNETNTWAFFCFHSVDKNPYANSDKHEFCLTWPEDTSNIKYDQRPKKVRKSKQFLSETRAVLLDRESSKEFMKKENGKVLHENNNMTGGAVPSLLHKDAQEMPCTIIDYFPSESGTKASVPSDINLLTTPKKNGRSKRIFKLAPKFDLPRQIPVRTDERMLKEVEELTKKISNEETGEKNKGSPGCQECPTPSDVIVECPHPNVEYLICKGSNELAEQSTGSAGNVVAAPIQMCPSVSYEALLPCGKQIVGANTEDKDDKALPEVYTTQPDILCSVKEPPECLTGSSAENSENIQRLDETGLTVYSQIRDDQDTSSSEPSFLGLPLSLRFAAQLVEHFGSPGVSLDTLLPDDYVVPLEWATSKQIYLQWKTSMEKKKKNNILKEGSMTEYAVDLEDSNKNEEERKKEIS
ncbi:uncharacterized protein LOC121925471 isoform X2 [Sceloporus undulatus]|nr:uncharacterized protein LOC121925471 isoform X2 [Sceloporus undulatus]XP_042313588.1 uncharacterized protein LOC121925471 isoform X2 [Sceloporus undulatus]